MVARVRTTLFAIVCLAVAGSPRSSIAQVSPGQVRTISVAIVDDGPHRRHADLLERLELEFRELLSGEFDVSIPTSMQYAGDWTEAGIAAALDRALADADADLVVATGSVAANILVRRSSVPRPAIAAFILGPLIDGDLEGRTASGVVNLNYVNAARAGRNLELLEELADDGPLAIALPRSLPEVVPDLGSRIAELTGRAGERTRILPVGASADDALALIPDDVAAVMLAPLPEMTDAEWSRFVDGLHARGLPTFSWLGASEVREGVLAGATPDGFMQQLLRWTALNAQQILLGADPSQLPVAFPPQERLVINMRTADRIGVSPSWAMLVSAQLIDRDERPASRRLSLTSVMVEARGMNLELLAAERFVAAGRDQVRLATAPLLPQVGLTAGLDAIDSDRAGFIPGVAQRSFTGGARLRQVIFDEVVWANRSIEGSLQDSRELDRDALSLDITREAGVAYLNVLRAKTFERIQRDNLDVTATNLDFARLRVSAGAANLSEVFRWEAQLSRYQQDVVDSEVARALSELEVNRLLNRPLEERFDTDEATLTAPPISDLLPLMEPYIDNSRDFEIFRGFMTDEAIGVSPEIGQIAALTTAQERLLQSANRSFFLPQISLEAGLENRFSESGAGADELEGFKRLGWNAALVFSYPLFTGTARFAAQSQASQELARLEIQRDDTVQRIDQRMRGSLHLLRGSWVKIELSQAAAQAADNNFRLVQDAYRRGVGDILGLLDAQNAALVASEAAASAVYDFLIDLLEVERAVGRFEYFGSSDERAAFFERLDEYYRQSLVRGN